MSEPAPQLKLDYQAAPPEVRRRAPAWVWTVVGVYVLLWGGVLSLPIVVAVFGSASDAIATACVVTLVLLLCGFGLLITPVKLVRERPTSRKTFLVPLIVTGVLMGALAAGAIFALTEVIGGADKNDLAPVMGLFAAGIVWCAWAVVFWRATRIASPIEVAKRFHHRLITGSVAELLVAVPSHLIVRRRNKCCAGIFTGTAICVGAAVMFVAFGPSVLLLYLRRIKIAQK